MQGLVMRIDIPDQDLHQDPVQGLVLILHQGHHLHLGLTLAHHPNQDRGLCHDLDHGLDLDHSHDLKRMMNVDLMIREMMKRKKQDLVKRRMKLRMNRNQKERT